MLKILLIFVGLFIPLIPWGIELGEGLLGVLSCLGLLLSGVLLLRQYPRASYTKFLLPLLLIFILGCVSLAWSINQFDTWVWVLQWGLAGLFFWLSVRLPDKERSWMFGSYVFASIIVLGVTSFISTDQYYLREVALFAFPAFLYSLLKINSPHKIAFWLLSILFILFSYKAGTNMSWIYLATGLSGLIYNGLKQLKLRTKFIFIPVVVLTILIGWGVFNSIPLVQNSLNKKVIQPATEFMGSYKKYGKPIVETLNRTPLLGNGAGTAGSYLNSDKVPVLPAILVGWGLLGVATLLLGIGILLLMAMRYLVKVGQNNYAVLLVSFVFLYLLLGFSTSLSLAVLAGLLLGLIYVPGGQSSGRFQVASAYMVGVVAVMISVSIYISQQFTDQGLAYSANRDYPAAAAAYQKAHAGVVYDPDTWTAEGEQYIRQALIAPAPTFINRAEDRARVALASDPHDAKHYVLLAKVYILRNDIPAAAAELRKALERDPKNFEANIISGLILKDHPELASKHK